jgi:hypothetical protein
MWQIDYYPPNHIHWAIILNISCFFMVLMRKLKIIYEISVVNIFLQQWVILLD